MQNADIARTLNRLTNMLDIEGAEAGILKEAERLDDAPARV